MLNASNLLTKTRRAMFPLMTYAELLRYLNILYIFYIHKVFNFILIFFQSFGDGDISGEQLHEILREIDTNMNGQVELDEYLQVFQNYNS